MNYESILTILAGALVFYVGSLTIANGPDALYGALTLVFITLSLLPLLVSLNKSE